MCIGPLANANILSDQRIRGDLVDLAVNSSDVNAYEHLYARTISRPDAPRKVFSVWSRYEKQSDFGSKWAEVGLNILRWSDLDRSHDWKSFAKIDGLSTIAYQQDSLVDLERSQYNKNEYKIVSIKGYQVSDTSQPIRDTPRTSESLLFEGKAPIGPDNKPVVVCKIGNSSAAPFVELSEQQRDKYTKLSGLSFKTCLSGSTAYLYWKARHGDFIDKYHDRKPLVVIGD